MRVAGTGSAARGIAANEEGSVPVGSEWQEFDDDGARNEAGTTTQK